VRRIILPIALIALALLMVVPMLRAVALVMGSGTPDATAISMDTASVFRIIIGSALLIAGVVLLFIRRTHETK